MKSIAYILLVAASASGITSGAETPFVNAVSADSLEASALAALNRNKKALIQQEQFLVERIYGKEKSKVYIEYFTKGLDSKTGAIMIEGGENQWLEIAFARGCASATTFMYGYREGKAE